MTLEQREAFKTAWRNREGAFQETLRRQTERAWRVAREAASLLKADFGAERVCLFGSLARGTFRSKSDIDLAVEGLPEREFFRAAGRLQALAPGLSGRRRPVLGHIGSRRRPGCGRERRRMPRRFKVIVEWDRLANRSLPADGQHPRAVRRFPRVGAFPRPAVGSA